MFPTSLLGTPSHESREGWCLGDVRDLVVGDIEVHEGWQLSQQAL